MFVVEENDGTKSCYPRGCPEGKMRQTNDDGTKSNICIDIPVSELNIKYIKIYTLTCTT